MSKHVRYMSARELLETFGAGKKGSRKISGDMVAWLLTEPPRVLIDAAAVLKAPIRHLPEAQPKPVVFEGFSFGAGNPRTD